MPTINLPGQFTKITGSKTLNLSAETVMILITQIVTNYPELHDYLLTPSQQLVPFMSIYVNQQDIRSLAGENTPLQQHDVVTLVPAMAGG